MQVFAYICVMAHSISDDHILQAALDVIAANGYAGATTRQIAAKAGINEVTLFRRFGNKQKLLLAIVEREAEKFGNRDVVYTGDLEADLVQILSFYQRVMGERGKVMMTVMLEVSRQPELMAIFDRATSNAKRFAEIIGRYQAEGKLATEPPMQALMALLGPIFLGNMLNQTGQTIRSDQAQLLEYVQRYLHGRKP